MKKLNVHGWQTFKCHGRLYCGFKISGRSFKTIRCLTGIRGLNLIEKKGLIKSIAFVVFIISLLWVPLSESNAAEHVTLQLKWKHQFQFAGYYAAVEKGYYQKNGLNVTLVEGRPGQNEIDDVISGQANFGVGMADILLSRLKGKPVVVLANIFQHSPSVLLAMKSSGISSAQDLFGRKIMMTPGYKSAELQAMLISEGVPINKIKIFSPSWKFEDLVSGKVSAMASYISSGPYYFKKKNLPYILISPRSYGIDFYGDNLFTSEQEIRHHPDRVKRFIDASLKGWQYALKNPEEIIDIILSKYASDKKNITRDFLINEARAYQSLILPDFVKIGHINPGRWKHIADTYVQLGMADQGYRLDGFIYDPVSRVFDWGHWAVKSSVGVILLAFGLVTVLLFVNRRINKEIVVRKKAEKESRESQKLFKAVFEQTGGYCMLLRPTDNGIPEILDANQAACDAHGYTKEEIIGRPVADLDDEEGKKQCRRNTEIILSGQTLAIENIHMRKDGSTFPVAVYANKVELSDRQPLIVTTEFDITEKKKAEADRAKLENQLQQVKKMESIGQLAGGIAHDFNNILYPIIGFTQLSQDDLPENHPVQENLQDILNGAKRARDLVKRILLFSRQVEPQMKPHQLQPVIQETFRLLRSTIPANIRLELNLYTGNDYVLCDTSEIHEIVLNLCTNAYHSIVHDQGKITISLKRQNPGQELNLSPGNYLCLSVQDNGVGIPENLKTKIFEPYVTTKDVGHGSGLGLAVVYGLVQNYKGGISVDSSPGQGSVFHIFLPVVDHQAVQDDLDPKDTNPPSEANQQILFVDDEPAIVKLGVRALERKGYRVNGMESAAKALAVFESAPAEFDLVITDMAMPDMVGSDFARRILDIRNDIPIIICSGFSEDLEQFKKEEGRVTTFLDKPLLVEDLVKTVRRLLDSHT